VARGPEDAQIEHIVADAEQRELVIDVLTSIRWVPAGTSNGT